MANSLGSGSSIADKHDMTVSDMKVSSTATVHGVFVGDVSPVKCGKNDPARQWFDSSFTDGTKMTRIVCFNPRLRNEVVTAKESGETMAISKCQIKLCKDSATEMEILLNSRSKVAKSAKRFKVDPAMSLSTDIIIAKLPDLTVNQQVTITGKIVSVDSPENITTKDGRTLKIQTVHVADASGQCKCVIWEELVGKLELNKSYTLKNATIKEFNGMRNVSLSTKSEVHNVSDIEDVSEEMIGGESQGTQMVTAEIVAVSKCESYLTCRVCRAKVLHLSGTVGECTKCEAKVKLSKTVSNVKVSMILEDEDKKEHRVTAFSDIIEEITKEIDGDDLAEKLLLAPTMVYTISRKDIVLSVQK